MEPFSIHHHTDKSGIEFDTIDDTIAVIKLVEIKDGSVKESPISELDLSYDRHYRLAIQNIIELGYQKLILDLSDMVFMDSSGIWFLIEVRKQIDRCNGRFAMTLTNKDVIRMITITKLEKRLPFFQKIEDAVRNLKDN